MSAEGRKVVAATRGPNKWTQPDAVVSSADGGAVMGTETPQRPRKEAAGSRDWTHPHDPDAGRTHLAHTAEQVVDLDTGAIVGDRAGRG